MIGGDGINDESNKTAPAPLELLEILSFGNSSASYDKITLLACPVETCRLATMRGNASLLRHQSSSPFMICANTVWKLGFGVAPYTPLR